MTPWELSMQFGLWSKQHPQAVLWGAGGLIGATLALAALGKRRRPAQTTHGSARFATPSEIAEAGLLAPHGVVCGRLGSQLLHDDSETHLLLLAPSGSGKGVGPIGCTLLTWQPSVLQYDPADGENFDFSHAWREQVLGQRVEQFTPKRSPHACINVSDMIRLGKPEEFDDAWTIAESLVGAAKDVSKNDTGDHFRSLAMKFLTAAHLHLAYAEPPASLGKLRWMLTQRYTSLEKFIMAMRTFDHTGAGVHRAIFELATEVQNITNPKELSGVWTTATNPLLPYADYYTQRSTDRSTVNLEDLQYGDQPMSVYLVAPSTADLVRLAPIYRVITDMTMHRLQGHKARTAKHRLLVIADEAPAYGYSRFLDKGAAEVRKYGIKLLIVGQDVPQLEDTFGRNNSIWGNTDIKIFFAPASHATAKSLVEAYGQQTVEQPVVSEQQRGMRKQPSVSYQQVGRFLMTADEFRSMHREACIIDKVNMRPILAGKVNCRMDPEYRERYQTSAA